MAGGFIVHGTLLAADYELTNLFRADTDARRTFPGCPGAHHRGRRLRLDLFARHRGEALARGKGLGYGIAIAFLTAIPMYLIYYAVQPIAGSIVVRQIIYDTICIVIVGIAIAWVYRGASARA